MQTSVVASRGRSDPLAFAGLPAGQSSLEDSLFAVLGVPYDATTSYRRGTRHGPRAILEASTHMESFDEELQQETCDAGIHTLPFLKPSRKSAKDMAGSVYRAWKDLLAKGKIPAMIGGEHSIAYGALKALKERHPAVQVLQFDAHCDLRDSYEGDRFSHACVARRMLELAPVTQVGIRSLSAREHALLKSKPKGLCSFFAQTIHARGLTPQEICAHLSGDLYISLDVDALDTGIMPSTGTPEPGGLGWEETLAILREATRRCRVVGFDVNELCPIPGLVAPDFLAAKLIYRIMGYIVQSRMVKTPR